MRGLSVQVHERPAQQDEQGGRKAQYAILLARHCAIDCAVALSCGQSSLIRGSLGCGAPSDKGHTASSTPPSVPGKGGSCLGRVHVRSWFLARQGAASSRLRCINNKVPRAIASVLMVQSLEVRVPPCGYCHRRHGTVAGKRKVGKGFHCCR